MAVEPFRQNIVFILGEQVAFTPTDLDDKNPAIVLFEKHYVPPDLSGNDVSILKNMMRSLFSSEAKTYVDTKSGLELEFFLADQAYPPCDKKEKNLVLRSLEFRKQGVLQDLAREGLVPDETLIKLLKQKKAGGPDISLGTKDTATTRRLLGHFIILHDFIDKYDSFQTCINTSDLAYGDLQLDLSDERVLELLRQFVFFTLQSHHPLQQYKNTNPTAPAFISRLETNPMGKGPFEAFMTTYKNNQLPIPEAIGKVLSSTELDPNAQKDEIQRLVDIELRKLLITLKQMIPEDDPIWKKIGDPNDVRQVLDTLYSQVGDFSNQIAGLKTKIAELEDAKKKCDEAKALLLKEKQALQKRVAETEARLEKEFGKDKTIKDLRAAMAAAEADYERRIAELERSKSTMTRTIEDLRREVEQVRADNAKKQRGIEELQTKVKTLLAALKAAKAATDAEQRAHAETRDTARTAREQYERDAAAAQTRFNETQAELDRQRGECAAKDAQIAELTRNLQQSTDELTTLRPQLQTANENVARLTTKEAELTATIESLQTELAKTEQREEAGLLQLQQSIQVATTELNDIKAELAGEKRRVQELTTGASEAEIQRGEVAAQLASAQELAENLRTRIGELEGELNTLRPQLAAEQERASRAEAATEEQRRRAEAEEARANAAADSIDEAKAQFDQEKRTFNQQLMEQARAAAEKISSLEGRLAQREDSMATTQSLHEEQVRSLVAAKEEKDNLVTLLLEAIGALDRNEEDVQAKIDGVRDDKARGHLASILTKLSSGSLSTAEQLKQEKEKQIIAQCYNVFLLNFLWNTNFPRLKENLMYKMVNNLFSTGIDPTDTRVPPSSTIQGLFSRVEVGEQLKRTIQYLVLIQKLFKLLSNTTEETKKKLKLSAEEVDLFTDLMTQIGIVQRAYKVGLSKQAYRYMLQRNPVLINDREYNVSYRLTGDTVECVSGDVPLSKALLFFCFLVLLRNKLNTIKTDLNVGGCPLPAQLRV